MQTLLRATVGRYDWVGWRRLVLLLALLMPLILAHRARAITIFPPTLSKHFNVATMYVGGSAQLTFTISNPNAALSLTGINFSDTFPAGMTYEDLFSATCDGDYVPSIDGTSVTISNVSLAPSASCSVTIEVTSRTPGTAQNTTGNIKSDQSTTGETASASILVVANPTASKQFGVAGMGVGQTTSLSFLVSNPASITETGIALSDPLPAGLVIATPNGLIGACGGGTISAPAGGSTINLTGASMPASGSCQFSVNVMATATGRLTNVASVSSTEGGAGLQATATIQINSCTGGAPYQNLNGSWVGVPGAVGLLGADRNVGGTTSVWALGTNAVPGGCGIYQYVGGGATWAAINGGATSLTVDNTGQPWVLQSGANHAIYRYSGGTFSAIPGAAYEISAGAGGDVWVIGTNLLGPGGHGIYQYVGAPNWWQPINGAADHIAVAPDHSVWVLQSNGDIYRYANGAFTSIPGKAQQISAGYDGTIYVVGVNQIPGGYGLYRYVGAPNYWQAINGAAIQIVGGGVGEFWVHQGGSVPVVPNALGASSAPPFVPPLPVAAKPTATPSPQAVNPPSQTPQKSPAPSGNTLPVQHQ